MSMYIDEQREISNEYGNEVADAIDALWNMRVIAKHDMMQRGIYVTTKVESSNLAESGSICQGHRACAVGSLYLGARKPMEYWDDWTGEPMTEEEVTQRLEDKRAHTVAASMPHTESYLRVRAFAQQPFLGLAYEALNKAALQYAASSEVDTCVNDWLLRELRAMYNPLEGPSVGWGEYVFENAPINDLGEAFETICTNAISDITYATFNIDGAVAKYRALAAKSQQ